MFYEGTYKFHFLLSNRTRFMFKNLSDDTPKLYFSPHETYTHIDKKIMTKQDARTFYKSKKENLHRFY